MTGTLAAWIPVIESDWAVQVVDTCINTHVSPLDFICPDETDPVIRYCILEALLIRYRAWQRELEEEAQEKAEREQARQARTQGKFARTGITPGVVA